ncbi:hypothetical protein BCR39DRAFT_515848 [Naematelia encephala]|uniref:Rho-GAP domain-containing protein n=1 Tax=Naematelia encephala TaxID=71784 RepID=A0A1Y2BJL7_9TREE|nr:hypothetical protein BCR39DRAFT_515848 [Naematelia encephala]
MAPVTLPPSFYNSFWSPDYRSGLEVLFRQLEQGCLEDNDVAEFIESQIKGHHGLASSLLNPPLPTNPESSSSSLQHTLLSLRGASSARGEAHRALALELEQRVLAGFLNWKARHAERIKGVKDEMLSKTGVVAVWEKDVQRLSTLRQTYVVKSRHADESEDDAKFAPATSPRSPPQDHYTTSPKLQSPLRRSGTVADRISEKLRAASISNNASSGVRPISIEGKTLPAPPTPLRVASPESNGNGDRSPSSPMREDAFIPPSDPAGKPSVQFSEPPPLPSKTSVSPTLSEAPQEPILISGLALQPDGLKDLLRRLDAYLLTTPAPYSDASTQAYSTKSNVALASRQRSTILGTYEKTFSGEEVVDWLRDNVEGFGGDWDRCVDAANELHKMGHFSRIGVGRGFDPDYDTFYVLKVTPSSSIPSALASPLAQSTSANISSMLHKYLPAGLASSDEPIHVRLRKEATKADEAYREAVREAETKRLEMEERIERGLRIWERWERERLSVVKSVLKQYEEALGRLPDRLADLTKATSLSIEAFNPEADIKALIEGNRTGPFRPFPHVYESLLGDVPEVNFGVDLRKWAGEAGWKSMMHRPEREKGAIPEVLDALLRTLDELYPTLSDDDRRRAWIYEVPLVETHALRNAINDAKAPVEAMIEIIKKYNVPVVAGVVKLFLLELNPPVMGWEGWEDAKAVYPSVGADQERDMTSAVTSVLGRLPGAQLYVLDAVVKHFRTLIDSTKVDESSEVYITKLALSVGRCILRPQFETELTIHDRTPSLFSADLISLYTSVLPPLVEKKKSQSDRVLPIRKRTALVDQRISRSRLSGGEMTPKELLDQQHALQHPRPASPSPMSRGTSVSGSASALGLGVPLASAPSSTNDRVNVIPSTPEEPINNGTDRQGSESLAAPEDAGEPESSTANVLEDLEKYNPLPEDTPVAGQTASSGALKRATSGETSRLRGPRGARGPRPAPSRVVSHSKVESMSSTGTGTEEGEVDGKGKGRAIGHGSKSSVSAMAAKFEGSS